MCESAEWPDVSVFLYQTTQLAFKVTTILLLCLTGACDVLKWYRSQACSTVANNNNHYLISAKKVEFAILLACHSLFLCEWNAKVCLYQKIQWIGVSISSLHACNDLILNYSGIGMRRVCPCKLNGHACRKRRIGDKVAKVCISNDKMCWHSEVRNHYLDFHPKLLNYSILYSMALFVFRMLLVMSYTHSYRM